MCVKIGANVSHRNSTPTQTTLTHSSISYDMNRFVAENFTLTTSQASYATYDSYVCILTISSFRSVGFGRIFFMFIVLIAFMNEAHR